MEFDFKGYLTSITPGVSYSIERLTGGVVNATARATKINFDIEDRFAGHKSLILKYAPPYIAGVGESAPMSQYRQTIEARALALFLSTNQPSLHHIISSSSVLVPKLLYHDLSNHILVLSDLGSLPNISESFNVLGGHNPMVKPLSLSQIPSTDRDLSDIELNYFLTIGSKLGRFFAELHSKETISSIRTSTPSSYFTNPDIRDVILDNAIKPIRNQLALIPQIINDSECETLYAAIEADFLRPTEPEEQCLVLGDCWTGAVLVDNIIIQSPKVGVIDWEFASIGRGPNGDMSQFMAHLELFRVAAEHRANELSPSFIHALDALVDGLTSSYRTSISASRSVFHENMNAALDPKSLRTIIIRSAMISHGAEMVNSAFWKIWTCNDKSCFRDGKHTTLQRECILVRKMVERGIWFLKRACKNEEEFCDRENWKILQEEHLQWRKQGRKWLLDLF